MWQDFLEIRKASLWFPWRCLTNGGRFDGQRLLVLTENQTAFVLDMNGIRAAH
jgi:hypothetical protein